MAPLIRLRDERGAELVELALVLPVLMLVLGGIADFGFLFRNYGVVTNAAREGARYAVLPTAATSDVRARVNMYLEAGGLLPGVATTQVEIVTVALDASRSFQAMRVGVAYPHQFMVMGPLLELLGAAPLGTTTLRAAAIMRTEVAAQQ